jgi:hypothetical protein
VGALCSAPGRYVSMITQFGGFSLFLLVLTPAVRESLMRYEERDVILVLPILALSGFNTFVLEPRARRQVREFTDQRGTEIRSADRSFQLSVVQEALPAVLVLVVAAVLVFKQPPCTHIGGMGNSVVTEGRRMPNRN